MPVYKYKGDETEVFWSKDNLMSDHNYMEYFT